MELVVRARTGDRQAVEALLQRSVPQLQRWAHGRLPPAARNNLDTGDLVQETVLHVLRRLDTFQPRHVGAMQAYLRQSVINRIRDEVRRIGRHPTSIELPEDLPSDEPSPLESGGQRRSRVAGITTRSARSARAIDELVVARIEAQWSLRRDRDALRDVDPDAARMAVARALASSDELGEETRGRLVRRTPRVRMLVCERRTSDVSCLLRYTFDSRLS